MIEEHGFDSILQEVNEVIMAKDVSQFVSQDGFQLRRREARQGGGRQEDNGPEPADDGGNLNQGGAEEPHRAVRIQLALQLLQKSETGEIRGVVEGRTKPADIPGTPQEPR